MTYAEFGRRPQENQSNGTDHGTAAPTSCSAAAWRAASTAARRSSTGSTATATCRSRSTSAASTRRLLSAGGDAVGSRARRSLPDPAAAQA